MALVPTGLDPNELEVLIDSLKRIGLSETPEAKELIKIYNALTSQEEYPLNPLDALDPEGFGKLIRQFKDAAENLIDVVHAHTSADGYRWFKLGEILSQLGIFILIGRLLGVERGGGSLRTPASVRLSVVESLVKQIDLPTEIRKEIKNLMNAIRTEEWTDQLRENIEAIKSVILDWLEAKA